VCNPKPRYPTLKHWAIVAMSLRDKGHRLGFTAYQTRLMVTILSHNHQDMAPGFFLALVAPAGRVLVPFLHRARWNFT
jgi:hypothetical protein